MNLRDYARVTTLVLVNTAARALDWLLRRYAPSTPPPGAWHPSQDRPRPLVPRQLTAAEVDRIDELRIRDQLRAWVREGMPPREPELLVLARFVAELDAWDGRVPS